jgi:hypothetical protein
MNDSAPPLSLEALADLVAARLASRMPGAAGMSDGLQDLPWRSPSQGIDLRDPRLSAASLAIAGVEFTQSIQHHGAVGTSYGADNGVPLVAYKTLVARVYPFVRQGFLGADTLTGQRVTGELTLSIGNRVVFRGAPTSTDGARLGDASELDRTAWDQELTLSGGSTGVAKARLIHRNCSLNFVVPAWYCRSGQVHAVVHLWTVPDGAAAAQSAAMLQFVDVAAPRVCLVRVNWDDGAGTITRPSDAAMLATLRLSERMLPFPYFETTILGTEVTSGAAFATAATGGGCNTAWSGLVAQLAVMRIFTALFQLGDIVFGMVPQAAIPVGAGSINSGCGRGAGGGFVGYDSTFAHEIGHLYGRAHTAVPGDASSDPGYPNYGGSRTSIGEVGIDTGTTPPTLFDPGSSDDIMSYGKNLWISPYTYRHILDARDMHQSAPVDPRRLRPLLFLEFRMHRAVLETRHVELRRAARIQAPGQVPRATLDRVSPVSIDLLDANERILATHHCLYVRAHAACCGCGCQAGQVPLDREPWLDFHEVIEWPGDDVAGLSFHDGGAPFDRISVGEAPSVAIEGPEIQDGRLLARVVTSHSRAPVSVVVLFSADEGVSWQPAAFDPVDGQVEIATERLPGGDLCVLRAIATAELQSASADSEVFSLPRLPRRLHVLVPSHDCGIPAGNVALSALLDTRGHGALLPPEIRWSSNLDGELGAGYDLTAALSAGRHQLTVSAPDGIGGTLSERAIIIVGGSSQRR